MEIESGKIGLEKFVVVDGKEDLVKRYAVLGRVEKRDAHEVSESATEQGVESRDHAEDRAGSLSEFLDGRADEDADPDRQVADDESREVGNQAPGQRGSEPGSDADHLRLRHARILGMGFEIGIMFLDWRQVFLGLHGIPLWIEVSGAVGTGLPQGGPIQGSKPS
jgi:hypothetical protein